MSPLGGTGGDQITIVLPLSGSGISDTMPATVGRGRKRKTSAEWSYSEQKMDSVEWTNMESCSMADL